MLNCLLCDYYSAHKGMKKCEFSDHLFLKNPADMDKYPCDDISFESYLQRLETKNEEDIVA